MIDELEEGAEKAKEETKRGIKTVEDYKKVNPLEQMIRKEKKASPEEQKLCGEIREKAGKYLKNGDIKGALKYLNHVRATL